MAIGTRGRILGASGVAVSLVVLAATAPAAAAPKPITGKLSKPGYTVIALADDGTARSARTRRGRFRLRPPAKRVTLHLRGRNGTYAGPIVIGRAKKGKRAIVGVKAGARLGRVALRRGYAKPSKRVRKKWVNAKRVARARRGIPIGTRVFGRVRSRPLRRATRSDPDLDGVPNPLDIDDDGDLILDTVDRSTAAQAAQAPPRPTFSVLPLLDLSLERTANANHPALAAQIDAALPAAGALILGSGYGPLPCPVGGTFCAASTELDCAGDPSAVPPRPGLVYCSRGGTGRAAPPGTPRPTGACRPATAPYPGGPGGPFDLDGDGFGTVLPFDGCAQLAHGATSAQIKTGDLLIERANNAAGVETGSLTQTLPYVFATVPTLVSYRDTAVPPNQVTLSYPYSGGVANAMPVDAGPDGNVAVTLTFWRPQRKPIGAGPDREACLDDTPPCAWIDLGGLVYGAGLGGGECPTSALSEIDPNLGARPPGPVGVAGGFKDSRQPSDQPANANATLTFTLHITRCLQMQGSATTFDGPGETRMLHLIAGGGGRADQTMILEHK